MFTIKDYVQPTSVEDAYETLMAKKNNSILGGCAFLRLGSKLIPTAIDLSKLDLAYIKEKDGFIEIGAMTSFRELETHPLTSNLFEGILAKAVSNVIGVQFRSVVTVGASVFMRYNFSDLITALLALDAEVRLYHEGRVSLAHFLTLPRKKDLLTHIYVKNQGQIASYQSMRKSASDFPLLNVAASRLDGKWLIAVGARPRRAAIATNASQELFSNESFENIEHVAKLASEELVFGSNTRASAAYREAMCQALVKKAVTEVLKCKSK